MAEKYETMYGDEWHEMYQRNQKLACCDCGLVHRIDFKIKRVGTQNRIFMRAQRNERATGAKRRPYAEKLKSALKQNKL